MDPSEQSEFWDERADAWARHAEAMEDFAQQFGAPGIDLLDPAPGEHLVDVGCGPGLTTFELARRVAPDGTVTGVDVSARMIASATDRAATAGVSGASFEVGDPGSGPIGSFDGLYSRFGLMFFDRPALAFENLCRSIRPGGRLVAVVWAEFDANPWIYLPTMFAAGPLDADLELPGPDEPGPFSLADTSRTTGLLASCGFSDVELRRLDGAWTFDDAMAADSVARMLSVGALGDAWVAADPSARDAAVDAVLAGCADHRVDAAWELPAAAYVISAQVP